MKTPTKHRIVRNRNDITEQFRDVWQAIAANIMPTGMVMLFPFAAEKIPAGWLPLIGQDNISSAKYPALARLYGATGETFSLPDWRDKIPVGATEQQIAHKQLGMMDFVVVDTVGGGDTVTIYNPTVMWLIKT